MADQLRMTLPTQFVLRALLADPQAELYGMEISDAAGLPSGTVHRILARLEELRLVQSRWEDIDPKVVAVSPPVDRSVHRITHLLHKGACCTKHSEIVSTIRCASGLAASSHIWCSDQA